MDLTDADKQMIQSMVNGEVHRMKLKIKELFAREKRGELPEKNRKSGVNKLNDRIRSLHQIKNKLDCWEGHSQQRRRVDG